MTNGTRKGWEVSVMPRPLFTPWKDPVPFVQEAGWVPGPVWTGAENLAPTGIRSPHRPARSQSLYRLSCPAHVSHRSVTEILYFSYICILHYVPVFPCCVMNFFFMKLVKLFWDSCLTDTNLIGPIHFNVSFQYQVSAKSIQQVRSWTFKWLATKYALCFCFTPLIQITPRKLPVTYLFSMTCLPLLFINCGTLHFWHCIEMPYAD